MAETAYSDEALASLDLFHRDQARILFYFEDAGHEPFYERLLGRLFSASVRIQVICLNGKSQVIEKAKRSISGSDQHLPPVDEAFIVDLDFDEILGTKEQVEGLFYLSRHSIENFLCQREAILTVASEDASPPMGATDARIACADFPTYHANLVAGLFELAKLFVVARKYRVPIRTSKLDWTDVTAVSDPGEPYPTADDLLEYRRKLIEACVVGGMDWLAEEEVLRYECESALPEGTHDWKETVVVGKHLLRCVIQYVSTRLNSRMKDLDPVTLYMRLASVIDVRPLDSLQTALKAKFTYL